MEERHDLGETTKIVSEWLEALKKANEAMDTLNKIASEHTEEIYAMGICVVYKVKDMDDNREFSELVIGRRGQVVKMLVEETKKCMTM